MAEPSWIENPEAWNTVVLGPVTLPGICTVTSKKGRDVDFKKSPGNDGGNDEDKGSNPGTVSIRVQLTAAQWAAWQLILPQIDPNRPGAASSPLEIIHPDPNSRGIRNVRVLSIDSDEATAKSGKAYRLECREWFPAPKKAKKGAKKNASGWNLNEQPTRMTSFLNGGTGNGLVLTPVVEPDNLMGNSFGRR